MKKFILFMFTLTLAAGLFARTPAESLIYSYENVKGTKVFEASGGKMVFVRPVLKKYPIGPMSDYVQEVVVLRMEKADDKAVEKFMKDLDSTLKEYRYYGKSQTPSGIVDVYVHLKNDNQADELVIYNPKERVLNSLSGDFPVKELLKLDNSNK